MRQPALTDSAGEHINRGFVCYNRIEQVYSSADIFIQIIIS
jgi:hypothetical protein